MKNLLRLLAVLLLIFVVDGASKYWAEQTLELHQPVPITGDYLRLTLGHNTGVAFGMFANGGPWPLIITGVIIAGLLVWFTRIVLEPGFPRWGTVPIGFLLGGAIGNFVDRLLDGRVTDFIDVGIAQTRWPTFNLADSFILIGVGLLMLISFTQRSEESRYEDNQFAEDGGTHLDIPPVEDEANSFIP